MWSKFTPRNSFLVTMAVVICIKVCLFGWGVSQFNFIQSPQETVFTIWNRWDSTAYQTLAQNGYAAPNVSPDYQSFLSHFPPLFPLLIAAVTLVVHIPVHLIALGVAWLFGILASAMLYLLVWQECHQTKPAVLSVLFFNLYPTAYFLITPYTESLFILCGLITFYGLRHQPTRGYIAGLGSFAAILTRVFGITLLPALAWELGKKVKQKTLHSNDLWVLALPIIAITIYLLINRYYFGQPLFFLQEYNQNVYSNKHVSWPFEETVRIATILGQNIKNKTWDQGYMMTQGWNAIATMAVTIITLWAAFTRRIPVAYWLYSLTLIIFFASFQWGISNARYTLAVWPIFMALGSLNNKFVFSSLLVISALFLLYFTRLFVQGGWAF